MDATDLQSTPIIELNQIHQKNKQPTSTERALVTNDSDSEEQEEQTVTHIDHIKNTNNSEIKPSLIVFIKNELLWSRVVIIVFTTFMSLLCLFYSIGQIVSLTIDNYWCQKRTLQEIRIHSKENDLPYGSDDCWSSKDFTVNLQSLFIVECGLINSIDI